MSRWYAYDALTGRFTQEDPIGLAGGLNLYGYANGDPVNFADPFGLCIPWPSCALVAAGAGARAGTLGGAVIGTIFGTPGAGTAAGASVGRVLGAAIGFGVATAGAAWLASTSDGWEGLSPEELKGKSPEEVDKAIPEDWGREATRRGGGTRYTHPRNRGEQIRVQPGNPNDPNPVKQGPYCRISRCGETSDPIPLKGNPRNPQ